MRVAKKKAQKRIPPVVTGLLVLLVITGASLGLALMWQNAQEAGGAGSGALSQGGEPASEPDNPREDPPEIIDPGTVEEPESPAADSRSEALQEFLAARRERFPYYVQDTGSMVEKEYFDDALFFGDSISVGIPLYGVMDNADIIAVQGVNTLSANTGELVLLEDGTRVTMLEAAKQYGEKGKIYIMLGENGIGYEWDRFMDGYKTFLLSVKEQYPDAIIYVQSMLPVTDFAHENYPYVSNDKIGEYNVGIMELARELGLPYVDVAEVMMDETGHLPAEASPSDGVHLTGSYYFKWFDYLRSHTVEK